jgi:hypothetical protein
MDGPFANLATKATLPFSLIEGPVPTPWKPPVGVSATTLNLKKTLADATLALASRPTAKHRHAKPLRRRIDIEILDGIAADALSSCQPAAK